MMLTALLTGSAPITHKALMAACARELKRALKQEPQVLRVAVDGGLAIWQAARVVPGLWVGDGDSCKPSQYKKISEQILLPREKEQSDLAAAFDECAQRGVTHVFLIGFEGGRADHEYAVAFECARYAHRFERLESSARFWVGAGRTWSAKLKKGQLVSIFAMGGAAGGVSLEGFKYGLHAEELAPGSRGLSNVALGGAASVSVGRGAVMGMRGLKI